MALAFRDVHVLVTGASGGIGIETAKLYCSLQAKVTAHYHTKLGPLKELLDQFPSSLQTVQADLSQEKQVVDMFATISQGKFGAVQVAVVNHGVSVPEDVPVAELSLDRWNFTIATNLTSSFLVCREYLKALSSTGPEVKDKAAIVFVGSTAGKYGEAGHADYATSKSGIMYGLTLTLKNEIVKIAPKGRVNCVAPGWVKTPMAKDKLRDPDVLYRALATTPLKKVAMPQDIAYQIVVLSSSTVSGHVTGQVVVVAGGMEGRLLNYPEDIPSDQV